MAVPSTATASLDPATIAALNAIITNYQRGQRTVGGKDVATSQLGGSGIDPSTLPTLPALGREGSYFAPGFFGSGVENLTYYDPLNPGNTTPPATTTPPPAVTPPNPGPVGGISNGENHSAGNSGNAGAAGDYAGHPGFDSQGNNLVAQGAAYGQGANGFTGGQTDLAAAIGLTPGSLGYIDLGSLGSDALGAATLIPGWGGTAASVVQALGRAYNTYVTDTIREQQGAGTTGGTLPPQSFGQWLGGITGLNTNGNLDASNVTVANPDQFTDFLNRQIPTFTQEGATPQPTFQPGSLAETSMGNAYQPGPGGVLGAILRALGIVDGPTPAMSVEETNNLINSGLPGTPTGIDGAIGAPVPVGSATLPPGYVPPEATPEELAALEGDGTTDGGPPEVGPFDPNASPWNDDGTINPNFTPPHKPPPPGTPGAEGQLGPSGPVGSVPPEVTPSAIPTPQQLAVTPKPPAPAGNAAGGVAVSPKGNNTASGNLGGAGTQAPPSDAGANLGTTVSGSAPVAKTKSGPPAGYVQFSGRADQIPANAIEVNGFHYVPGGSGSNGDLVGGAASQSATGGDAKGGYQGAGGLDNGNAGTRSPGDTGNANNAGTSVSGGSSESRSNSYAAGGFVHPDSRVDAKGPRFSIDPAVERALMEALAKEVAQRGRQNIPKGRSTEPDPEQAEGMASGGFVQQQEKTMAKKPVNDGGGKWTHPSNTRAGSAVSKYPHQGKASPLRDGDKSTDNKPTGSNQGKASPTRGPGQAKTDNKRTDPHQGMSHPTRDGTMTSPLAKAPTKGKANVVPMKRPGMAVGGFVEQSGGSAGAPPAGGAAAPTAPTASPDVDSGGHFGRGFMAGFLHQRGSGGRGRNFAAGGSVGIETPGQSFADGGMVDDMDVGGPAMGDMGMGDPGAGGTAGQGDMPGQPPSDGIVDNQEINADEGEYVLRREAAGQIPPEVLQALNDPVQAGQLGQILSDILAMSGGGGGAAPEPDGDEMGGAPPEAAGAPPSSPGDRLAMIGRKAAAA